jgi:hypothetical protein
MKDLDPRFVWYWRVIGTSNAGTHIASAICETEAKLDEFHDAMHTLPGVDLVETAGPFPRCRVPHLQAVPS